MVIHEALKALFNITMNFFTNENESCLVILTTLEKQLDCLVSLLNFLGQFSFNLNYPLFNRMITKLNLLPMKALQSYSY